MVTWETTTIGEIADFQGGSQPPLTTFSSQRKFGYLRLIQIRDYKTDKYQTFIPTHLAKRFCSADDIMIGRYGPPIFQILRGLSGAYNVALIKAIPKNVDKEFLYYTLTRKDLFDFIELLSRRSSGQTGVDLVNLRAFEIPLPPLPEQHAIAAALSDVDGYIAALERLIAKKRNIKQGTMQELLTGKRRLPGFNGEWVEKRIGDIADVYNGGTPNTAVKEFWDGSIVWVTPSDITSQKSKYLYFSERNISEKGLNQSGAVLLPEGTILLCTRATIGELSIAGQQTATNQGFKNLVVHGEINNVFIYYLLQTLKPRMIELAIGSTFLELSKSNLLSIQTEIPSAKAEQDAIAAILSDMDAEIDALTAKLAKLRNIKQGMMQELLTGRIRLTSEEVEPAPAVKPTAKVMKPSKREPQPVTMQTSGHNNNILL